MKMTLIIFLVAFPFMAKAEQSAAEIYASPPGWGEKFANCACIKNVDGVCMTFGYGPYPYRQYDEYISGPHCVTGCYPGFSDLYGWTKQTKIELSECRIDWTRLRHEQRRDDFPEWQW